MSRDDGARVPRQSAERVDAAVDELLADRRPVAFAATPQEAEALAGAALLAGSRAEVADPQPAFVDALAGRLRAAAEAGPTAAEPEQAAAPLALPHRTGRRAFLLRAGAAAAAAAAAGVAGDRVYERVRGSTPDLYAETELLPAGATWRDVAALDAVRSAPTRFRAGSVEGYVVSTPDGGVAAYSAVCTHLGCLLEVAHGPDRMVCPCHGATFDLDGRPDDTNYQPLARLPWLHSRVNGDRVEVLA